MILTLTAHIVLGRNRNFTSENHATSSTTSDRPKCHIFLACLIFDALKLLQKKQLPQMNKNDVLSDTTDFLNHQVRSAMQAKSNPDEIVKLQQRLSLLREEYVKLQKHCEDIEKDRVRLRAQVQAGLDQDQDAGENFVFNILKSVAAMYQCSDYSDMQVILDGNESIPAHKFVMNSRRAASWNLDNTDVLDWSHLSKVVGEAILQWIYTDQLSLLDKDDAFKLDLMKASKAFNLSHLLVLCERALIASVDVRNCIKLYTTAEEIGANELKDHCSQLISTHWVREINAQWEITGIFSALPSLDLITIFI